MAPTRDPAQYGNEKEVSVQHYLIQMRHRIYTDVDRNSQKEAISVILSMVDWSQAFDRQSHKLGIQITGVHYKWSPAQSYSIAFQFLPESKDEGEVGWQKKFNT